MTLKRIFFIYREAGLAVFMAGAALVEWLVALACYLNQSPFFAAFAGVSGVVLGLMALSLAWGVCRAEGVWPFPAQPIPAGGKPPRFNPDNFEDAPL